MTVELNAPVPIASQAIVSTTLVDVGASDASDASANTTSMTGWNDDGRKDRDTMHAGEYCNI